MKLSVNRLEDMLLSQGSISKEQHSKIREYILKNKVSSTVAITKLGIMDLNSIYRAIAKALKVEFVPINDLYGKLNRDTINLLSENICKAFCVLPWEVNGNELKLLIENPQDTAAIKEAQDVTVCLFLSGSATQGRFSFILGFRSRRIPAASGLVFSR